MSVQNGQDVSAEVTNAAFMSRTENTDTVGSVGLLKPTGSGSLILDTQKTVNNIITTVGMADQDATTLDFTGTTHIVDGTVKDALEDLDSALTSHISDKSTHGVTGDIVGTTDAQVLTNKDIDGGTASNTSRITLPKNTKTNLDGLTRKEGTVVYATDEDKVYYDDGTVLKPVGSGSGGSINFITNPDGSTGTTGWTEGSFTAAARPSGNFTASSGAGAFAISTTTTTPLGTGTTSFLLTKSSGASRQGRAAVTDFVLPLDYRAKVLKIDVNYIINSGTFVAGSNTTDSSLIWYCAFSTDNGSTYTVAEPSSFKLLSNSTTISDRFSGSIQTPYNATNMRLIAYVAETANSAWVVECITSVSPSQYVYGTPITDWQSYTPTGSLTTNTTYSGKWRRVGDTVELQIRVGFSGTNTQGILSFTSAQLLNGLGITPDFSKLNNIGDTRFPLGTWNAVDAGVNGEWSGTATYSTGFGGVILVYNTGSSPVAVNTATPQPFTISNNDNFQLSLSVPILGWSSSVQVSDGYDGRVIAANVQRLPTGAQSIPNNAYTAIGFDYSHGDETASWILSRTAGSSYYLVPSAGWYRVSAVAGTLSPVGSVLGIAINSPSGADYKLGTSKTTTLISGSRDIKLKAGDKVYITIYQNSGSAQNLEEYWVEASISKLSGNPTIAASETVACNAALSATTSVGASITQITGFGTPTDNSHGAFANNEFTAPVSGRYFIEADIMFYISVVTNAGTIDLLIRKDGSTVKYARSNLITSVIYTNLRTSLEIRLKAGEKISFATQKNGDLTAVAHNDASASQISIFKIGN